MLNKQTFKLTFLPLFEEDLLKVTDYITNTLQNPSSDHRLVDDIELTIVKRLEMPLSFSPYHSSKIRNHPYYRINVRNFSIFYVIIDNTMEVRRILYSKRNIDELIK
ncbi:type II toxin-antitoxin system RelE/ParE family toxin [uncultured Solobacterium sp.]|uniref:type II toxin-antitoxin system RelE/ParE family toxin n=1 Tax=uncultured Solobacterium sp. TaxID=747375 RepID=UPI0028D00E7D|nr:type II toxin-antitoxin system RelE/ParE family toxin [uncultured Solobacterium sp.]